MEFISPLERAVSANVLRGEVYTETLHEAGVVTSTCFADCRVDFAILFENMRFDVM